MQGPLNFFFSHSHPQALYLVGPQEVFVRIVKWLFTSIPCHSPPMASHWSLLSPREPESCRPAVHLPNPPLSHLCTAHPPPFCEHHSVKRGGEAEPSLHTAQLDSLPPVRPGHRRVLRQTCRPTGAGTQHMHMQMGTCAHKRTLPACTLGCAPH